MTSLTSIARPLTHKEVELRAELLWVFALMIGLVGCGDNIAIDSVGVKREVFVGYLDEDNSALIDRPAFESDNLPFTTCFVHGATSTVGLEQAWANQCWATFEDGALRVQSSGGSGHLFRLIVLSGAGLERYAGTADDTGRRSLYGFQDMPLVAVYTRADDTWTEIIGRTNNFPQAGFRWSFSEGRVDISHQPNVEYRTVVVPQSQRALIGTLDDRADAALRLPGDSAETDVTAFHAYLFFEEPDGSGGYERRRFSTLILSDRSVLIFGSRPGGDYTVSTF